MRKLILVVLLLFLAVPSWASCRGIIRSSEKTLRGVILVNTEYFINDVSVGIDRKTYFPEDLAKLTDIEVIAKINQDIKDRCFLLIQNEYRKTKDFPEVENRKTLNDSQFTRLQGLNTSIDVSFAELPKKIDSDGDGFYDQEWFIKTDGTKRVITIAPVPVR